MTPEDKAWMVRWKLLGKPKSVPLDMLLTVPAEAIAEVGGIVYDQEGKRWHGARDLAVNLTNPAFFDISGAPYAIDLPGRKRDFVTTIEEAREKLREGAARIPEQLAAEGLDE